MNQPPFPGFKPRPLYRLWLRNRRHFLTMEELSRCSDLTLGEVAQMMAVARMAEKAGMK